MSPRFLGTIGSAATIASIGLAPGKPPLGLRSKLLENLVQPIATLASMFIASKSMDMDLGKTGHMAGLTVLCVAIVGVPALTELAPPRMSVRNFLPGPLFPSIGNPGLSLVVLDRVGSLFRRCTLSIVCPCCHFSRERAGRQHASTAPYSFRANGLAGRGRRTASDSGHLSELARMAAASVVSALLAFRLSSSSIWLAFRLAEPGAVAVPDPAEAFR